MSRSGRHRQQAFEMNNGSGRLVPHEFLTVLNDDSLRMIPH